MVKDRFPLPLIEDKLGKLQNSKIFSTLDLKNGFFHVLVEQESRKYTAFVTHKGMYQFIKMPFGICNAPSVFQRYINRIFNDLINQQIVLPYLDDIIIPAADENEALSMLKTVLEICQDYGLEINKKKCHFLKTRIEFLGHIIENGKLYPSNEKTKAVMQFPEPKTAKQIQSYLGLTGYFRKFIPYYSIIARPLSDLLKKNNEFRFGYQERMAFENLKKVLCDKPVLNIYKQFAETELHTDASQEGYGAILLQKDMKDNMLHPVYYMSRKTTDTEKKYNSYELEVLAIVEALKKFRVYLLGLKFKIVTDCSAFTKTMEKKDLQTRVARWAMFLEEFDYTIEHRPGSRMKHVDSLSRHPINMITVNDTTTARFKTAQDTDTEIKAIKELLKQQPFEDYVMRHDLLYKQINETQLLVLPKCMHAEVIQKTHDDGHLSAEKVKQILKQDYFIPKMATKVAKVISNCVPCILVNRKRGKQEGYLHPLPKGDIPLHTYHVDHLGPLESTNKNYKYVLLVVDAFSKYIWLYPTKTTATSEVIAKLEFQKTLFGNPVNIFSDRGTAFTSDEFEEYCSNEGVKHFKITTGLPRANGQAERINSLIIPILSKLAIDDPTKWYKYVAKVQMIINSSQNRSTGTSPFQLLTGVIMRHKAEENIRKIIEEEFQNDFEESREELRNKAKLQIQKIQEENKRTYNLRRRPAIKYKQGDLVAIKRTQMGPGLKLKTKYLGPYEVSTVKYNNTYNVQKVGCHEGPMQTSTCAEYMKPWTNQTDDEQSDESEADSKQHGRVVGKISSLNQVAMKSLRGDEKQ